jgi:hypothetical protein
MAVEGSLYSLSVGNRHYEQSVFRCIFINCNVQWVAFQLTCLLGWLADWSAYCVDDAWSTTADSCAGYRLISLHHRTVCLATQAHILYSLGLSRLCCLVPLDVYVHLDRYGPKWNVPLVRNAIARLHRNPLNSFGDKTCRWTGFPIARSLYVLLAKVL